MTAGENPFASYTSSLQNQLKGSSFLLCFFSCSSILVRNFLIGVEGFPAFFCFLSAEKDKELLAAKAEIEALRTNEELKNRAFGEVCYDHSIIPICVITSVPLRLAYNFS